MAKFLITIFFSLTAHIGIASPPKPQPYTSHYNVYEDGSIKAAMTSTLKKIDNNHYQLLDITEGTAGLASLLNFNRTEKTNFAYHNNSVEVTHHSMQQKVAFKKKHYAFNHQPGELNYKGIDHKKPFQLSSEQTLLSTQLISWQLTQQICHRPKNKMQWSVLKSEQPKIYTFKIVAVDNQKTLVHRKYQNRPDKSTAIWINTEDCYIEEIIYKKDNKVVRTILDNITFH